MKQNVKNILTENLSYKVVALFIALILWLTILGRRDFVMTKNVELEFLLNPQYQIVLPNAKEVQVKVSGPRSALKKFSESRFSQLITVDVGEKGPGIVDLEIPVTKIELPFGVKLISVKPSVIRAEIVKTNN
ncbi:MAG: CdaR family protein [Pseudobdellovibrionaceae bacterium]